MMKTAVTGVGILLLVALLPCKGISMYITAMHIPGGSSTDMIARSQL